MASMIGRFKRAHWHLDCDCISSRSIKAAEATQWRSDYLDEIQPPSELDPDLACYSWSTAPAWECE